MHHWPELLAQLHQLETLLRDRCRQLLATCFLDSDMSHHASSCMNFPGALYEGRWHEVVSFLSSLIPLLPLLSRCWDEGKFSNKEIKPVQEDEPTGAQRSGPRVIGPSAVTKALQSPLSHCYAQMVCCLVRISADARCVAYGVSLSRCMALQQISKCSVAGLACQSA